MFNRSPIKWSPVEITYLQENLKKLPADQLCIALGKSRGALQKKIKELKGGGALDEIPVSFQSKIGKREDLDLFVRSGWEANFARICKIGGEDITKFEYEPETFSFTEHVPPKGMALSYTPDFKITKGGKVQWVEVKGNWLRAQDKTKMRRFKKYFPEEFKKLTVVVSTRKCKTALFFEELGVPQSRIIQYSDLKKKYSKLVAWE